MEKDFIEAVELLRSHLQIAIEDELKVFRERTGIMPSAIGISMLDVTPTMSRGSRQFILGQVKIEFKF